MSGKLSKFILALLFVFGNGFSGAVEVEDVQSKIRGLNTNFNANFSYTSNQGDEGMIYTGKIYYQYPNKLHVQLSDGRIIATNGKYLWTYNPDTKICARQVVKEESTGGLFFFLHGGYSVQEENDRYIFKRVGNSDYEVTIKIDGSTLKTVQWKIKDEIINISFSNVVTDTSMKSSLFNYKPDPEAQLIENPLNRIAVVQGGS